MFESDNSSNLPPSNTENSRRIYPQLLDKNWDKMPIAIKTMHLTTETILGVFTVTHGKSKFAKLIARLLNCPKESKTAHVTLQITPNSKIEKWNRTFNQDNLITKQWVGNQGFLLEQWGHFQMQLQLHYENNTLYYGQKSLSIHFGKLFLKLPSWLQPKINAYETIGTNTNQVLVHVEVKLPFIGLLIQYDGNLNIPMAD
jgi:hypothetical protein